MQNNGRIFRLQGVIQRYNWGGFHFLPGLLNIPNPAGDPCAEYWMGAHPKSPALVEIPGEKKIPLDAFLREVPTESLGAAIQQTFGGLPYLLKVLDVKDMLSIQVHPNKKDALACFEAENRAGIPPDAPNRNYRDANHKPELMLALDEFWLLHGFKNPGLMQYTLSRIPELHFLIPVFDGNNYSALYKAVMEMDQDEVNTRLQSLLDRIVPMYENELLNKDSADFWAARAAKTYCSPGIIDRGLFSVYLLNLVKLRKGEAVFQDAGILHAYLEGQNIEIMSNSDNVLRGGLTNKHVDVPELMKHVRFVPVEPEILNGLPIEDSCEDILPTPAPDFELRQIFLDKEESCTVRTHTAEIFFGYEGMTKVACENRELSLNRGEAILALAGTTLELQCREKAWIFHATVPFPQP